MNWPGQEEQNGPGSLRTIPEPDRNEDREGVSDMAEAKLTHTHPPRVQMGANQ